MFKRKAAAKAAALLAILLTMVFLVNTITASADGYYDGGAAGSPSYIQQEQVGHETGTSSVSYNGTVNYSYPMGDVALVYSSNGGWSVSAGSAITRSTRSGIPTYEAEEDTFLLDGKELVYIRGTNPREYHTKEETWRRIRYYNPNDAQNSYWIVERPDGSKAYYAAQKNGSTVTPVSDGSLGRIAPVMGIEEVNHNRPRAWAITEDWSQGEFDVNYYTYYLPEDPYYDHWEHDWGDAGSYYLASITSKKAEAGDDGGTTTILNWGEKEYLSTSYRTGSKVRDVCELESVEIYNSNNLSSDYMTSSYHINWMFNENAEHVVESIEPGGYDDSERLEPVTFEYYPLNKSFSDTPDVWYTELGSNIRETLTHSEYGDTVTISDIFDFDGDGLPDKVVKHTGGFPQDPDGNPYLRILYNNGAGFSGQTACTNSGPSSLRSGNMNTGIIYDYIDLNGDGRPDRVWWTDDADGTLMVRWNLGATNFNAFSDPCVLLVEGDSKEGVHNLLIEEQDVRGAEEPLKMVNTAKTFMDMNGDGLADRIGMDTYLSNSRNLRVHFNSTDRSFGSGSFSSAEDWGEMLYKHYIRDNYYDEGHDNTIQTYSDFIDMNGDGLPDGIYSFASTVEVFFNLGHYIGFSKVNGEWYPEHYHPVGIDKPDERGGISNTNSEGNTDYDFIDMNGDGLPDRVLQTDGTLMVALNYGGLAFGTPESWGVNAGTYLREYDGSSDSENNCVRDYIDMNGDGLPDRVSSVESSDDLYIWYNQAGGAGKLKAINNGQGGVTSYNYQLLDRNDNPDAKHPMWVVESETVKDGMTDVSPIQSYTTTYQYYGGVYDSAEKKFMGFDTVIKTGPTGERTETELYTTPYYTGLPKNVKAYNSLGDLFNETSFEYLLRETVDSPGAYSVLPYKTEETIYDGDSSGITNETNYFYDPYGNLYYTNKIDGVEGNMVTTQSWYNYDVINWNLRQLHMKALTGTDRDGLLKLQSAVYYDYYSDGNVRKKMDWLQMEGTIYPPVSVHPNGRINKPDENDSRWKNPIYFFYDTYGNINRTIDPKGNSTYFTYDTKHGRHLVKTENAKGHTTWKYYDDPDLEGYSVTSISNAITRGWLSKVEQEQNGTWTKHYYDSFGRPERELAHGASYNYPNIKYDYIEAELYDGGSIYKPMCVKVSKYFGEANDEKLESYTYMDGLGRVIQIKDEYNGSHYSTVDSTYRLDYPPGEEIRSFQTKTVPYATLTSDFTPRDQTKPKTNTQVWLDSSEGLKTMVTGTDGTHSQTTERKFIVEISDQNNNTTTIHKDGFGNTMRIVEPGGQETSYGYDIGTGRITRVEDDNNNVTIIDYNSLGNKINFIDPDMGIMRYVYDASGNVTHQSDSIGNTKTFEYDELDRLTKINYHGYLGTGDYDQYTYDDSSEPYGIGKLVKTEVYRGGVLLNEKKYSYGPRGNIVYEENTVDGVTRSMDHEYDYMGRVNLDVYPDSGERVNYSYSIYGNGMEQVFNDTSYNYVTDVTYMPSTKIYQTYYGNGTTVNYGYWDDGEDTVVDHNKSYLLKDIYTSGTNGSVALEYTYDNAGNITEIADGSMFPNPPNTFIYDDLNRLTSAQSNLYGTISYSYNDIGNMTEKDSSTYCYGGDVRIKPHAVKNDGTYTYLYDAKGNMSQKISYQSLPGYVMSIPEQLLRYAVYGTENVTLNDRATVKLPSGVYAPIASNGQVSLGSNAISGDIIADNVWLRDAARVYGSIQTRHTITKQNATIVKGIEYEGTSISNSTLPNSIPSNNLAFYGVTWTDTYVNPGQSVTLTPGTYWNYGVNSGGELNLESGEYYFNSLTMNSGTTLNLDETNGPVTIYVQNNLTMRALINHSTPGMMGAANLLIGYVGTQDIYLGGQYSEPFRGSVIAPNASIIAGQECRKFEGMYIAKKVNFHQDSKVTYVPFSGFAPQVTVYTYDWNNRLIEVQEDYETTMKAAYDIDGERVKKEEGDTVTYYFFPQYEEEYDIGTGTKTDSTYYYFVNGSKMARRNSGEVNYYVNDHLGSTICMLDESGNTVKDFKYMPYGTTAYESGAVEEQNRFNNKELDSTGLYYYGSRYYDPVLGRFISADPVIPGGGANPQGLNRYSYCFNNPLRYIDPTGHDPVDVDRELQEKKDKAMRDFEQVRGEVEKRADNARAVARISLERGSNSVGNYTSYNAMGYLNTPFGTLIGKAGAGDYTGYSEDYLLNFGAGLSLGYKFNDSLILGDMAMFNRNVSQYKSESGRIIDSGLNTFSNNLNLTAKLDLKGNNEIKAIIGTAANLGSANNYDYNVGADIQALINVSGTKLTPSVGGSLAWERLDGMWMNNGPKRELTLGIGVSFDLFNSNLHVGANYGMSSWDQLYDVNSAAKSMTARSISGNVSVDYPKFNLHYLAPNAFDFRMDMNKSTGANTWYGKLIWDNVFKK